MDKALGKPTTEDTECFRRIDKNSVGKINDPVKHPSWYTEHPSGIECIEITQHMNFCLGNATKYIWRAGLKGEDMIQDLEKAKFYIDKEIERLQPGR